MKKYLSLLLALLISATSIAQTPPPVSVRGQSQSKMLPKWNIQIPNQQVTNMGGIDALFENGNHDILQNSSFENSTVPTSSANNSSWTASGCTFSFETSTGNTYSPTYGKQALKAVCVAQTLSLKQASTLYAASLSGSRLQANGRLNMYMTSGSGTIYLCPLLAGTSISSNFSSSCQTLQESDKYVPLNIPFTPGATSNGIEVLSNGAVTGTYYFDDGGVDIGKVSQTINQVGPWISFTPTGSWSTNTTYTGKYRQVGENLEVQYKLALAGAPTTASLDLNLPTINGSVATIDTNKLLNHSSGSTVLSSVGMIIDSGTANFPAYAIYVGTSTSVRASFAFVSGSNVAQASITQAVPMTWASGDSITLTINVPITQFSGVASGYSSTNADTDWAAFTPTGTWVSNATYFGQWRRVKDEIELQYYITTSGAPTAANLTVSLPTVNGSAVVIDTAKLLGFSATAGAYEYMLPGSADAVDSGVGNYIGHPIYSSTTAIAIGRWQSSSGTNPVTLQISNAVNATNPFTFGSGDWITMRVKVPVVGWTNSNITIAQLNGLESCTDSYQCTDTFSAKVSSTGVVTDENIDWIQGNCAVTSTSTYTCTYKTGLNGAGVSLTNAMNCVALVGGSDFTTSGAVGTSSTAVYTLKYGPGPWTAVATSAQLICQKAGSDYLGKTAKAVASDANDRTPGVVGVKTCHYSFGGAASTLASPVECTTGTCIEVYDSCGTGSPPAWATTAIYNNLTFAAGTFANSTPLDCRCTAFDTVAASVRKCELYFDTSDQTWVSTSSGGAVLNLYGTTTAGTENTVYVNLTCKGQAP